MARQHTYWSVRMQYVGQVMDDLRTPGRTRTAVERGETRRKAIIDAAIDLIAVRGSRGTTLADVGEAAGVSRPGVLHHFASKNALLEAVLETHERLSAPAFERIARPGGLESVLALAEIARKDVSDRRQLALWSTLVGENTDAGAPLHDRLHRRYVEMRGAVEGFLREAAARGELRDDVDVAAEAIAIMAFLNGIETSWLLDPSVPIVAVSEQHLAAVVARLRRPPAG
jgi:AcrR family transcriptional regulator